MDFVSVVGIIALVAIVAIVYKSKFSARIDGKMLEMEVQHEESSSESTPSASDVAE